MSLQCERQQSTKFHASQLRNILSRISCSSGVCKMLFSRHGHLLEASLELEVFAVLHPQAW